MADDTLILLQKQDSFLNPALEAALGKDTGKRLVVGAAPPLPRVAYSSQGLVVWNLAGYEDEELAEITREMASDQVGVLLTGDNQSPLFRQTIDQVDPLGIIAPGQIPEALSVTLALAWDHHRRAHDLRGQVESLRDELSDRLVVEKAKRLLMDGLGCSEDEAMRRLQRHSRNTNQKMAKVAQQLIAGHMVFGDDNDTA